MYLSRIVFFPLNQATKAMWEEEKYGDDFVSTSVESDDEFVLDAPQNITMYSPEDIPWQIRNFPSWCPMVHFSPIQDGLNKNSIAIANTLKLQFYGTILVAIIDYIITIILVAINKRSITILGSGFLSYVFFDLFNPRMKTMN